MSSRPTANPPVLLSQIAAVLGLPAPTHDVAVTGITGDSRAVQPGDLYCGIPGHTAHGARFAAAAIEAGAVAVLTDHAGAAHVTGVPVILVADPRAATAHAAACVYHRPHEQLTTFAVTGTNGKTTTTFLLDAALRHLGLRTGLVGTVQTSIAGQVQPSVRTTPEAYDLQALLARMVHADVTACSLEVSSHALVLHRVTGLVATVAGFTNLSQDHLDFHTDLDDYFLAKAKLFTPEYAQRGVIFLDDAYSRRLAAMSGIPTVTVSFAADDPDASSRGHWHISDLEEFAESSTFTMTPLGAGCGEHPPIRVTAPLPGRFNVANTALAIAMLAAADMDLPAAIDGIARSSGVPGRMEAVSAVGGPLAVVDYAHTPDSVAVACQTLRAVTPGQLVVVLGAGGDRDAGKRPGMGAAAAEHADVVIITDDNPRSEDPATIRDAVAAGAHAAPGSADIITLEHRGEAIRYAVSRISKAGDTVLVAGKGHEQGQDVGGTVYPFDDRTELRNALTDAGFAIRSAHHHTPEA